MRDESIINIMSEPITYDCVFDILNSKSIDEIITSVTAFIDYADKYKARRKKLCKQLMRGLLDSGTQYLGKLPEQTTNVVFIPPEAAPVMMITGSAPITEENDLFIKGLHDFLSRCNEFTEPNETCISVDEMNKVLEAAQTKFQIMDIIAPVNPLKVVSLNNSHYKRNCECGIAESVWGNEAVIFVYHPNDVSVCDRVFIFAHEIGHALHLAVTGDVRKMPEMFDDFNKALGVELKTLSLKQEAFADVTAFAILSTDELREHLPHGITDHTLPYYEKFIKYITNSYKNALVNESKNLVF